MSEEGMPAERVVKISDEGERRFLNWGCGGYCIVPFGNEMKDAEKSVKESSFSYSVIWEQDSNGFRGSLIVYPKEKRDGGKWLDFGEMEKFAKGLAESHGKTAKTVTEAKVFFGNYGFNMEETLVRHGPETYTERMKRRISGEVFLV